LKPVENKQADLEQVGNRGNRDKRKDAGTQRRKGRKEIGSLGKTHRLVIRMVGPFFFASSRLGGLALKFSSLLHVERAHYGRLRECGIRPGGWQNEWFHAG
jgi:hypothetical protein